MKRHRSEDGIPKEEEEKPRKQMLSQKMVRRNSCAITNPLKSTDFLIVFFYAGDHIMRFCASHQYDINRSGYCQERLNPMIIRPLTVFEREKVREFYLSLSADDRRKRFCCTLADETISKYVDRLNFARDTVLGAFDERAHIIGLAELVLGPKKSEMAFSVRPDRRGEKIGTTLLDRLIARAAMCGIRTVFVMFLSDNTPMRKMATRAGMLVDTAEGESHAERDLPVPTAEELASWFMEEGMSHGGYFSTLGVAQRGALLDSSTNATREPLAAIASSA